MTMYWSCHICESGNLDPGEPCDCRREIQVELMVPSCPGNPPGRQLQDKERADCPPSYR